MGGRRTNECKRRAVGGLMDVKGVGRRTDEFGGRAVGGLILALGGHRSPTRASPSHSGPQPAPMPPPPGPTTRTRTLGVMVLRSTRRLQRRVQPRRVQRRSRRRPQRRRRRRRATEQRSPQRLARMRELLRPVRTGLRGRSPGRRTRPCVLCSCRRRVPLAQPLLLLSRRKLSRTQVRVRDVCHRPAPHTCPTSR